MEKQAQVNGATAKLILTVIFVFCITGLSAEKQIGNTDVIIESGDSLIAPQYASRYFILPSAFPLKKEEVYYRTFIVVHQLNMGISKNFELGLGTIPLFLFDGTSSPIWLSPKISIPTRNENLRVGINASVGRMFGKRRRNDILGDIESNIAGLFQGVLSYQEQNISVSIGVGSGYWGNFRQRTTYTLSAQYRVRKRGFIMIESFYIPNSSSNIRGLNFIGGRKVWKNQIFLDFGLVIPTATREADSDINFIAIPWVNVAIPIIGFHHYIKNCLCIVIDLFYFRI